MYGVEVVAWKDHNVRPMDGNHPGNEQIANRHPWRPQVRWSQFMEFLNKQFNKFVAGLTGKGRTHQFAPQKLVLIGKV